MAAREARGGVGSRSRLSSRRGVDPWYEAALAKLAPTGLIVADNTLRDVLTPSDESDRVLDALNARWAADERVIATQLTVRDDADPPALNVQS